jgi:hypothetical protein
MASDVLALADAIAVKLNVLFVANSIAVTATRQYEVTHELGLMTGRKVEVYPLSYNPFEAADRSTSFYDFRFSIVTLERYETKGLVPKVWLDERVNFVEEFIFNPLDPTGKVLASTLMVIVNSDEFWPIEVEVTSVYDIGYLRRHKVFWSEVEVAFRKVGTV